MRKVISFQLGQGSLEQGFPHLVVQIYDNKQLLEEIPDGQLPPNLEIATAYQRWQWFYSDFITYSSHYGGYLGNDNIASQPRALNFSEGRIERGNEETLVEVSTNLVRHINQWLNSEEFRGVDQTLRDYIHLDDEVVLVIQTENEILRQLPWNEWDFVKKYRKTEVVLSAPHFSLKQRLSTTSDKVRILAIIGDCTNINPEADLSTLRSKAEVELEVIVQPSRQEICACLRDKPGWDILFYAGHSESNAKQGWLNINENTKLEISELNSALEVAIENGLQLAIFNSCQGLGLVPQLEKLGISQIIVMREQVQNQVAQEFLLEFIESFSSGKSLYLSTREAREKLKDIETEYYCASWLPVICQHWSVTPPTWEDLRNFSSPPNLLFRKVGVVSSGLLVAILLIILRSLGWLQPLEFQAFDWLVKMRLKEGIDSRILIVEATQNDVNNFGYPLSDETLATTIEQIEQHKPSSIGLFIFRDFAKDPLLGLLQNNENVIASCRAKLTEDNPNNPGIPPPPGLPETRLGFSNALFDEDIDGVLRRHLLNIQPDVNNPCSTRYSFSVQLALDYLHSLGIESKTIDRNSIQIGETFFKRLQPNSGAYQDLDNRGFQILLNYRSPENIAPTISITDVLENNFDPELIMGRIVIIGVVAPISNPTDYFPTPYSQGVLYEMSGVYLQAQMVSQIISAVLDKRPLLTTWSELEENAWILFCSLVGSGIVIVSLYYNHKYILILGTGMALVILLGGCYVALLVSGLWIPLVPGAVALTISSISGHFLLKYWSHIISFRKGGASD